jgi:multidrug efflux pump subunit AcrA (membrane-fusion protein)
LAPSFINRIAIARPIPEVAPVTIATLLASLPDIIEKASLNVDLEKLKLQDLQLELDKSRLISPVSGEIVFIDKLNVGDYVNARKTVITVEDPSKLSLQYTGDNASEFQLGMKVDVKYMDNTYPGEVVMTPSTAPVDIAESLKKTVRIKVDGLPPDAKIGGSASLSLILQRNENTIALPKSVVSRSFGRATVQVLDKGIKYERDVEIGIETPTEVEILKGINEGDKVIVH